MKALTTTKQDELVVAVRNKAVTDSAKVAAIFHKQHKNVLQSIENLDCSDEFSRLNFQPRDYVDDRGKSQPLYQMSKNGFTFLVMGFRGKKAAQFKESYIAAFDQMEKALRQMATQEHQQARLAGKFVRRGLTDEIKIKIEYATSQGSTHADNYYTLYSKMINAALGIKVTSQPDTRDRLEIIKQNSVALTEEVCRKVIGDGIAAGLFYKDIYKISRDRVQSFVEVLKAQGLVDGTTKIEHRESEAA